MCSRSPSVVLANLRKWVDRLWWEPPASAGGSWTPVQREERQISQWALALGFSTPALKRNEKREAISGALKRSSPRINAGAPTEPPTWARAKLLVCLLVICAPAFGQTKQLRVCADPDNLPFSNTHRQGFENRIATLLASDLHERLTYEWQRMGRGFVREYLNKEKCDLLIGIPSNFKAVLTTRPYYRSTYVFVSRRSAKFQPASFNDLELHRMKIGVQVLEDDYAPPAHALARRGMQANIVGFESTGADASSLVDAVAHRKVDLAITWGPFAGYFAKRYPGALNIAPVQPEVDPPGLPFTFAISMGVRKGNQALRDQLNGFLQRRERQIQAILHSYGVPEILSTTSASERGN
jgi:mxaJ protein